MNKEEVKKLLGWVIANYPHMQDKEMGPTAELWEKMLKDIPYKLAEKALMKIIATSKYFPTVAEIREAVAELSSPALPSWSEAWGEVQRAIRHYGYYRQDEALASMSPEVARVVRRIGWREICASEDPDVIRGQFRMAWEAHVRHCREMAQLPGEIRELVGQIGSMKELPESTSEKPVLKRVK